MFVKVFSPRRTLFGLAVLFLGIVSQAATIDAASNPPSDSSEGASAPNLAATQESIEMRYRRFEDSLVQLREYLRKTDPSRAELLGRATGKSNEDQIRKQLRDLTELLKKDQLSDAAEQQELVIAEFQSLLELLMSEARKDELELEKKRIQDAIKDVSKLIGKQTDARAETERGGNHTDLQNRQKQVADSTKKLVQKIETHDASKKSKKNDKGADSADDKNKQNDKDGTPDKQPADEPQNPDAKESDGSKGKDQPQTDEQNKDGDKKPGTDKPSDNQPPSKPSDQEQDSSQKDAPPKSGGDPSKPDDPEKKEDSPKADSKPGKSQPGKPQPSKPQKGKPQQGNPDENQEQQQPQQNQEQDSPQEESAEEEQSPQKQPDKTPGRDELKRAKLEMDRAIEELKKNNKQGASDKQDKALAELMKAKEKLEEILRLLREEERELVLVQMEVRFRDMLLKQEAIYNATLALHAIPVDSRTDRHRNRSVELARTEEDISVLAAKALTLLKEEGSSVAFPDAVEQIRDDMQTIARRLERVDVGEITQNIEQDTIECLKEIIEAMQKELEKLKDKKQQQQGQKQQQQQQPQEKGLINQLAELKMLRSLQFRVNRRTKQLGRLVDGEQAVDLDVISQLKQLSDRQAKVQKATYDLATGKTQ